MELTRALAYCEKHKILPFFDHPDVHLHQGRICIDDQSHVVISAPPRFPASWLQRFDIEETDYQVSLQLHMDRLSSKLQLPSCADAGDLFNALRSAAQQRSQAFLAEAGSSQDAAWEE